MTPSEFKKLVIPYREIRKCDIELLEKMIKENQGIEKIIAFVNSKTIDKEWESKDIAKIDEMRKKLMSRRIVIDK